MRQSQEAVNYRNGFPTRRCSMCQSFVAMHRCRRVEGLVAAHKLCDLYSRRPGAVLEDMDDRQVSIARAKERRWAHRLRALRAGWEE